MNKRNIALISSCLIILILSIGIVSKNIYNRMKNNQNIEKIDDLKNVENNDKSDNTSEENINTSEDEKVLENTNNTDDNIINPVVNNSTNNNIQKSPVEIQPIIPENPIKVEYKKPVATFSKNGDTAKKLTNETSISTLTGDYVTGSMKYMISTESVESNIDLESASWENVTVGANISLSNLTGSQYVWVQVTGLDLVEYTYCTESFNMALSYDAPVATFSKNGDTKLNIINTTSVSTLTGDYAVGSIKYMISTESVESNIDLESALWQIVTVGENISIANLTGNQYVWVRVLGLDGTNHLSRTQAFNMIPSWTKETISVVAFDSLSSSNDPTLTSVSDSINLDYLPDGWFYDKYTLNFKININTPNLDKIEYCISFKGEKGTYETLSFTNSDTILSLSKIISVDDMRAVNGRVSNPQKATIWFKVNDHIELNPQTWIFKKSIFDTRP